MYTLIVPQIYCSAIDQHLSLTLYLYSSLLYIIDRYMNDLELYSACGGPLQLSVVRVYCLANFDFVKRHNFCLFRCTFSPDTHLSLSGPD